MRIGFDIGNVLVQVDFEEFYSVFKSLGVRKDPFTFLCDIQGRQDIGVLTMQVAIREILGVRSQSQVDRLMKAWDNSIKPNKEMLDFVDDLKEGGAKVALLSNMGPSHADHIRKIEPRLFEGCILHLSGEVGARKPTKLYYQSFLMQNKQFEQCLFVDDRQENLDMAESFGMDGIHFALDQHIRKSKEERAAALGRIKSKLYEQMLRGPINCRRH